MNSGGSTAATRVIMWRTRFNESYGVSDAQPVCADGSHESYVTTVSPHVRALQTCRVPVWLRALQTDNRLSKTLRSRRRIGIVVLCACRRGRSPMRLVGA